MRKGYLCFKMGSCVSIHEKPDSATKLRFDIASKADKILNPLPTEEKSAHGDHCKTELGFKSQSMPRHSSATSFRSFGSKDEMFFDSQPWVESDADDFFSVNGDFTPSCVNTPIHQSSFRVTPQHNKSPTDGAVGSRTQSFRTDKKKKLAELFLESFRHDQNADNQTLAVYQSISNEKLEPKPINSLDFPPSPRSTKGSPYRYGFNSIRTPNRDFNSDKEKSTRAAQWCLPSFVCGSLSDRKKRLSPWPKRGAGLIKSDSV